MVWWYSATTKRSMLWAREKILNKLINNVQQWKMEKLRIDSEIKVFIFYNFKFLIENIKMWVIQVFLIDCVNITHFACNYYSKKKFIHAKNLWRISTKKKQRKFVRAWENKDDKTLLIDWGDAGEWKIVQVADFYSLTLLMKFIRRREFY